MKIKTKLHLKVLSLEIKWLKLGKVIKNLFCAVANYNT